MSLCSSPIAEGILPDGFCADVLPVSVRSPRGISGPGPGGGISDVLVCERGSSRAVLLHDSNGDLTPDTVLPVASGRRLTQSVVVNDGYLYASSDSTVWRWPYTPGDLDSFPSGGYGSDDAQVVIQNINTGGVGSAGGYAHNTRTMTFDSQGRFYVQIGSQGNVDYSSYRARVRRFDISDEASLPLDYISGELFADGLRNTVGLAWDRHGVLWGVDNGGDLFDGRPDLGIDIPFWSEPADELNRLSEENVGGNYGFPYCWTEWNLPSPPGLGAGTPWVWPLFMSEDLGAYTDEWCRDNTIRPALPIYPHSAALGLTFYQWRDETELPDGCTGAFPREMDGYVFMAFHGSYRVTPPTGYKVVYAAMDADGNPVGTHIDLLHHDGRPQWQNGFRPVDLVFDGCGRLVVTSDSGSIDIVRISYEIDSSSFASTEGPEGPDTPSTTTTTTTTTPLTNSVPQDTTTIPPTEPTSITPPTELLNTQQDTTIPPTDITIPPTDITIPPADITIPPTDTNTPLFEVLDPPTETDSPPTETNIPPTETTSNTPPTENNIPPTETTSITAPVDLSNNAQDTAIPPPEPTAIPPPIGVPDEGTTEEVSSNTELQDLVDGAFPSASNLSRIIETPPPTLPLGMAGNENTVSSITSDGYNLSTTPFSVAFVPLLFYVLAKRF